VTPGLATPVLALNEIDSTNAEARRRAEAGEGGPLWITAKRQTQGRGRRGRTWSTGTGDLAATLLITSTRPAAEAAQVSFVAALAVADLLDAYAPPSLVTIKWPNDVHLGGRKVSGILVESGSRPDGSLWLALGVGVNLVSAPNEVERPAAALIDHLRADVTAPPTPETALDVLGRALTARVAAWEAAGFEPVAQAWRARAEGLGRPCAARLGSETIEGVAEALEDDGALRLRLASGAARRITAGDVFFS
jgi:BirA family biotin operon repressor/biotin-[acetyl-CoA-carboxylase] ligase